MPNSLKGVHYAAKSLQKEDTWSWCPSPPPSPPGFTPLWLHYQIWHNFLTKKLFLLYSMCSLFLWRCTYNKLQVLTRSLQWWAKVRVDFLHVLLFRKMLIQIRPYMVFFAFGCRSCPDSVNTVQLETCVHVCAFLFCRGQTFCRWLVVQVDGHLQRGASKYVHRNRFTWTILDCNVNAHLVLASFHGVILLFAWRSLIKRAKWLQSIVHVRDSRLLSLVHSVMDPPRE